MDTAVHLTSPSSSHATYGLQEQQVEDGSIQALNEHLDHHRELDSGFVVLQEDEWLPKQLYPDAQRRVHGADGALWGGGTWRWLPSTKLGCRAPAPSPGSMHALCHQDEEQRT